MKYLPTYKSLKIENDTEKVFEYFLNSLTDSIFTWEYFVDFNKVKEHIVLIEKELNLLNVLIGKQDIEKEFLSLIKEYPKVRSVLPILIAVRKNKIKETKIIDDFETLISENKEYLFDSKIPLTKEYESDLLIFFNNSGLKKIFQDKNIKNLVDYVFGVEVGMDTNARKNRTGKSMEKIVEVIVQKFIKEHKLDYISQATKSKIKEKFNFDIEVDKTERRFDFAIFNKSKNKIYIIETNYYSGQGSKVKATAGEYKQLYNFLKNQKIDLIWVTDGLGWRKTKRALSETFIYTDYIINIELIKNKVLNDIIL